MLSLDPFTSAPSSKHAACCPGASDCGRTGGFEFERLVRAVQP
jgi:hypothetical protein